MVVLAVGDTPSPHSIEAALCVTDATTVTEDCLCGEKATNDNTMAAKRVATAVVVLEPEALAAVRYIFPIAHRYGKGHGEELDKCCSRMGPRLVMEQQLSKIILPAKVN